MSVITERINKTRRPVFYVEVVVNDKGYELLADLWVQNKKGYFVILNYWHQIHDPYETPKKVMTLAELVICPITLQMVKKIESSTEEGVTFNVRRCDLEGYAGWDVIDYE